MIERYDYISTLASKFFAKISIDEAATLVIKEAIKRPKEYAYLNVEDYSNFGFYNVDEIR